MNRPIADSRLDAFAAAIALPDPVNRLGRALWLYLALVSAATTTGQVVRSVERLAGELGVSSHCVDRWAGRLADAGLIRILTPGPFLAIALDRWPGTTVSSSPHDSDQRASMGNRDGGETSDDGTSRPTPASLRASPAGSGLPTTAEIRATLEDSSVDIAVLITGYSADLVARALARVRATPQHTIRKSKTALFRYLLTKLSTSNDDQHQESHHAAP